MNTERGRLAAAPDRRARTSPAEWVTCLVALSAVVALLTGASGTLRHRWWLLLAVAAAAVLLERTGTRLDRARRRPSVRRRPADATPVARGEPSPAPEAATEAIPAGVTTPESDEAGPAPDAGSLLPADPDRRRKTSCRAAANAFRSGEPGETPIRSRAFQVAKSASNPDECEDGLAFNEAGNAAAVADGASSSFMAREWAVALARGYVEEGPAHDPATFRAFVDRAAGRWVKDAQSTAGNETWWVTEAEGRGSFATFVGVNLSRANAGGLLTLQAVAVGDACVAQLRSVAGRWTQVCVFPVEAAAAFGSHPDLISTRKGPDPRVPRIRTLTAELQPDDRLVLMTDALAQWVLTPADGQDRWQLLLEAESTSDEALAELVATQREEEAMVDDDVSLVILTPTPLAPSTPEELTAKAPPS